MSLSRTYNFYTRTPSGKCYSRAPYGLPYAQWNNTLSEEFGAYRQWRTSRINLSRPVRLLQRTVTFNKSLSEFENYFGYLVTVEQIAAAELRLSHIADLDLLKRYVIWHATERSDGPTRYMEKTIGTFATIAHYYLQIPSEQWGRLNDLRRACKPDVRRDKRRVRVSLDTLEQIALAERPTKHDLNVTTKPHLRLRLALQFQRSLMLRLLIRRPMRSRNMREMKTDLNLYREHDRWWIEFRGEELKVARRRGRQNVLRYCFPADLVPDLEEFLTVWRPLLPGSQLKELFTTKGGQTFSPSTLNQEIKKTIYTYTGRPTNIHVLRDIWATEFLMKTQDFITAAEILGDRVETVLQHYADLYNANAGEIADTFTQKILS